MTHIRRGANANANSNNSNEPSSSQTPSPTTTTTSKITTTTTDTKTSINNSPYLPTATERLLLASYPLLLAFGALFATLSPETRAAPFDAATGAHAQDPRLAPSYFARKDNFLNVLFVKRGWAWISLAFVAFVVFSTSTSTARRRRHGHGLGRLKPFVRWALVTAWWVLVTQWCFGPALIDRGFRWSGGKCAREGVGLLNSNNGDAAMGGALEVGKAVVVEAFSSAACKAAGGRWRGGHDISGHVFMLVLGSAFLVQEVGWVVLLRGAGWFRLREERCVVLAGGGVARAGVEGEGENDEDGDGDGDEDDQSGGDGGSGDDFSKIADALGWGGKFAVVVVGLCYWMMLMTAIYFHTWFEKLTGLLVALAGLYVVYILPRWVPALRSVIGLPGI